MNNTAPILNPTVFLGGFEWREPMTTITDFMIGLTCLLGFFLLGRLKGNARPSLRYYRLYFLMFGIGMSSAAWLGHGLQAYLSYEWKMIGWCFSVTGQTFLVIASLMDVRSDLSHSMFGAIRGLALILYVFFLIWLLSPYRDFTAAQTASGVFSVGLIIPLQLFQYLKQKTAGSLIIIGAIAYGILPAMVYNQQWSIHRWFNYHDISHILLVGLMGIMIFGVRKLQLQHATTFSS